MSEDAQDQYGGGMSGKRTLETNETNRNNKLKTQESPASVSSADAVSRTPTSNIHFQTNQKPLQRLGTISEPIADLQYDSTGVTAPATANITNVVYNRQISLSQQTFNNSQPMQVGTLIGGERNLSVNATGNATVNIYTESRDNKPQNMASEDPLNEQLRGYILHECQQYLRHYYINSLCKVPLIPGDYENLISLKDIYTNLLINMNLPKPCRPLKIPLASYNEMFTRKSGEGVLYTRLLISAPAGLGKSTITAKIAYDWATKAEESPLRDVPLLFVLNMRWLDHTSNLEDAILSQILPEDTNIKAEQLLSIIRHLGEKVIIILDAVDESDRMLYNHPENSGSIVKLLTGRILVNCRLMVMTRPWRITDITKRCNTFQHFEIRGFRKQDVINYIKRFFGERECLRDSLIEYMSKNELIANVASVPLMALLICVYWSEIQGNGFPKRISHLYDAIINIMDEHQLRKQAPTNSAQEGNGDLQILLCQLGNMALKGMWPPENRIVFSPDEASDEEMINKACQIGLLSKQESRFSVFSSRKQTSLTFFHKTCGEKCAGVYLAYLADENPEMLALQLQSLKTVQDTLSIQLILRFACGTSSVKSADTILRRLIEIFHQEIRPAMSEYCTEDLELDDTLKIQQFIELCLGCNYESDNKGEFSNLLSDLFVEGKVHLLGVSEFNAIALGYYMSHSLAGHIRSVTLRPIPHAGDIIEAVGPLHKVRYNSMKSASLIPLSEMKEICKEYLDKCTENVHVKNEQLATHSPAIMVPLIQMWQACDGLPTDEESNISPIISSVQHVNLEVLDITGYKLGDNVDVLLSGIENGHLAHLVDLRVSNIGINGRHMERLATAIGKMPLLKVIDTSLNTVGESMKVMVETISSLESLQVLHIHKMHATVQSMSMFAQKLPEFATHLNELRINGNDMDDTVAIHLASHLSMASLLKMLWIDVGGLSRRYHNQLLSAMQHLSHLQELRIYHSQYADDLMVNVADVIGSLQHLYHLTLHIHRDTSSQIKCTAWQHFKTKLHAASSMKWLYLHHIALEADDFLNLVLMCRKNGFKRLSYNMSCLPAGVAVPKDDFFLQR